MKKAYLYFLISLSVLIFPVLVFADGGMVVWPPTIHLDQFAQNTIIGWNGSEEIMILSIDIESTENATVLRIIPLPSNPSEIKEGSFESFDKLVEIMNQKIEAGDWKALGVEGRTQAPAEAGIEITFQQEIGAHDITVVKVNNLDYFLDWVKDFTIDKGFEEKEISSEFREGIKNYLKKDIKYFVFDVIGAAQAKESVKPLVYRFETGFLYYPLLISGSSEISESQAEINLFLITEKEVNLSSLPYSYHNRHWFRQYIVELTQEELESISSELSDLFDGETRVTKARIYNRLGDIRNDLILFPSYLWEKNLVLNTRGSEVKALQQILINDGFWESEVEATGYFGLITKTALAKFQERYNRDILKPVDLETGTGYFGSQTKDYFKRISFLTEQKELSFSRNLSLGMRGEDIKALQEILIEEKVWGREDIGATGYFGLITKEAVMRYQEKYASEILEPLGLIKGTGFVGSSTRAYLEKKD